VRIVLCVHLNLSSNLVLESRLRSSTPTLRINLNERTIHVGVVYEENFFVVDKGTLCTFIKNKVSRRTHYV
jgi:hypothetical protein